MDIMLKKRVVAPETISDRQFFQQLAEEGEITWTEFNDAVGPGILPASLEEIILILPESPDDAIRQRVRGIIRGAMTFDRSNENVALLSWGYGWSPERITDFWSKASKLK